MTSVLIIDDNVSFCRTMSRKMSKTGDFSVTSVHSLREGIEEACSKDYDVVFLDVMMPDGNGLEALPDIKSSPGGPEVIIITGKGEKEGASIAINSGAWDYVQKGSSLESLMLPLTRALQYRNEKLEKQNTVSLKREGIVGSSPEITACLDMVARAAGGASNVIIQGETGTGKELFAMAIHENSARKDNNFVVLDCTAVPEKLLESTLFGHVKGAFTGADRDRKGVVEQADQGTLFLDEIGELPLSFQKAFLRVLQEKRFRPVGSSKERESDFRVVAATNRDLGAMAELGQFRKDLLFRLNTFVINIPPLRERKQDIKELAAHYIEKICEKSGSDYKGYAAEFLEALMSFDWPGNVRELVHALEHAVTLAGSQSRLYSYQLPPEIRIKIAQTSLKPTSKKAPLPEEEFTELPSFRQWREAGMDRLEVDYLTRLMNKTGGNMDMAEQISGTSRSRLYKLLKKHGLGK